MEGKKSRPAPRWQVILEDIRSQNQATIEAVEASHSSLERRIDLFEHRTEARFTVVETAIGSMGRDIVGLQSDVVGLKSDVIGLRADVAGLRVDVTGLQGDVAGLRVDVVGLQGDVAGLRVDVTGLQGDVAGLRGEVASLRGDVTALQGRFDQLDRETRSRDASLEGAIQELKVSVQQNSADIRDLTGKVDALSQLEERVSALERRQAADVAGRSPTA